MDNESFEQVAIAEGLIDAPQFLRDGDAVSVLFNTETETPMSAVKPFSESLNVNSDGIGGIIV